MNSVVLLIGDGPFANFMATRFKSNGFSIIMTTRDKETINKIRALGYIPIYASNLYEDGCEEIYKQCMNILREYSLELKFIVHTARGTCYEFEEKDPPDNIKAELFAVNSKSPALIAKHFKDLDCQFVFISSCATTGFKKSLNTHTVQNSSKRLGTHGIKYYSYTKRLGEEALYHFYKRINKLSNLTITYISVMFGTNFFKDMGIPDPDLKGYWNADKTAYYIVDMLLKGKKRIYPGWQSKIMKIAPRNLNQYVLNAQRFIKE